MDRRTPQPWQNRVLQGFTIVELLIVVVVIAILAAITIVAYNGVTSQAKESALKSDLKNGASQLTLDKITTGSYPSTGANLKKASTTTFSYTSDASTFCLQATSSGLSNKSFYITQDGSIQPGNCTTLPTPATMQAMTSAYCASLPIYDGSNSSAIRTLTDNRGGTVRSYEIAKLADSKCWMLTNLKLGSTASTVTLTPSDSNVASNFVLPQLTAAGPGSYDNPRAYGPVPGDTGAGTTNYGYLYNWPAATAGETQTTKQVGSTPAAYSICPAGWRLPTGGVTVDWSTAIGDYPDLDRAFGGTGRGTTNAAVIARWNNAGPFKGALSGYWSVNFSGQGTYGDLWSASSFPEGSYSAASSYFRPTSVDASSGGDRDGGLAIRCVLN